MPNALIIPPSTKAIRKKGPPSIPAMSAHEPVSHAVGLSLVSETAPTGRM